MKITFIQPTSHPEYCKILTTTSENGCTYSRYTNKSYPCYSQLKDETKLKKLITLHQEHGINVVKVHAQNYLAAEGTSADALYTEELNVGLGVITADCYPVVLVSNKAVAAMHCGWRSTIGGLIEKTIKIFNDKDNIGYAYIGPGISASAFEVKDDFLDNASKFLDVKLYTKNVNGKYFFDLEGVIVDKLKAHGIYNIERSAICTYSDVRFYSHRRDPANTGRMITLVYKI